MTETMGKMIKMVPEVKVLFLEALRSGKYEQGNEVLKQGDKHCCLGVLCELAVAAGVIESKVLKSPDCSYKYCADGLYTSAYGPYDATALLPNEVQMWSGLTNFGDLNKSVRDAFRTYDSLVALNDSERYSFAQIADIIEEQF